MMRAEAMGSMEAQNFRVELGDGVATLFLD